MINNNSFKLNMLSSVLLQAVSILSGLILPRLILGAFGSEVNGLISSITQFLSYLTLLEAGVGSVARVEMFKPLADKDERALSGVINGCRRFFVRLSYGFFAYILVLGVGYALFAKNAVFSFEYIFALIVILGIGTYVQNYSCMTEYLLLQADQKLFIPNILRIVSITINLLICAVLLHYGVDVYTVKIVSAVVFCIRPLGVRTYVKRKYLLDSSVPSSKDFLKQRRSGLIHHIAFFIHRNTDVAMLTFFTSYKEISVYAVYNMVVFNIQNVISMFGASVISKFGEIHVRKGKTELKKAFSQYETLIFVLATLLFTVTSIMIVPFVEIYTKGILDADYSRPMFAMILVLTEYLHAIKTPYNNLIFAVGELDGTKKGAVIEAALNIVVSLVLVKPLGLIGVVVGTSIAMGYRLLDHVFYLKKYVLKRRVYFFIKNLLMSLGVYLITIVLCKRWVLPCLRMDSLLMWALSAAITTAVCALVIAVVQLVCNKKAFREMFHFFEN